MIVNLRGLAFMSWIVTWTYLDRPAYQHAIVSKSKVVVESCCMMLLDEELLQAGGTIVLFYFCRTLECAAGFVGQI